MLELKNISFQVADENAKQKEIIKDISLKLDDHTFTATSTAFL